MVIRTPDLRFRNEAEEDHKTLQNNDLEQAEGAAYRPAYREMPPELAQLVAVWHKLPEPIRKAIRALADAVDTDHELRPR